MDYQDEFEKKNGYKISLGHHWAEYSEWLESKLDAKDKEIEELKKEIKYLCEVETTIY